MSVCVRERQRKRLRWPIEIMDSMRLKSSIAFQMKKIEHFKIEEEAREREKKIR